MSLVGALCYAELATAYAHAGGNYHYLAAYISAELGFSRYMARSRSLEQWHHHRELLAN